MELDLMTELLDLTGIAVSLVSHLQGVPNYDYFICVLIFWFQKEDSTDEERLEDRSETNTEQIMIQAVADMVNEMKMLQIENGKLPR